MKRTLSTLFVLTSAIVAGQRPSFAGSRPIGFPEAPNRTTTTADGLGDRFGEGTTERLPVQANGDRDLIDRLSKLPIDKQPFWFINWQAIEANNKNPQSYPQRPSGFVDPVGPINSAGFSNNNQGFSSSNQGISNNNQGFSNNNQGFSNNNQGFPNSNQGFSNGNPGFSNRNPGFPNGSPGFSNNINNVDPNNSFTNSINGVPIGNLLPNNPGAANSGNSGFTNQAFSSQNQGFSPPNQGFSPPNQGFPPQNQGFTPPNQLFSPSNQGFSPPNQGFSPPSQGFSPPNQGFLPPNQGFPPPSQGSPPNGVIPVPVYQVPNQSEQFSKPQEFTQSVISNQHFETKLPGRVNVSPSVESRFSSTSAATSSTSTTKDKPTKPGALPGLTTNYNYKWNNSFHHTYNYNYKTNSSYYVPNSPTQQVTHHDIVKLE